jgi:hypothetical protein
MVAVTSAGLSPNLRAILGVRFWTRSAKLPGFVRGVIRVLVGNRAKNLNAPLFKTGQRAKLFSV